MPRLICTIPRGKGIAHEGEMLTIAEKNTLQRLKESPTKAIWTPAISWNSLKRLKSMGLVTVRLRKRNVFSTGLGKMTIRNNKRVTLTAKGRAFVKKYM